MAELVKNEGPKQIEAFEVYYALGKDRSVAAASAKTGYPLGSVSRWARSFKWRERVTKMDAEARAKLEERFQKDIVKHKSAFLKYLMALVRRSMQQFQREEADPDNAEMKPKSMFEVIQLMKTAMQMMGDTIDTSGVEVKFVASFTGSADPNASTAHVGEANVNVDEQQAILRDLTTTDEFGGE